MIEELTPEQFVKLRRNGELWQLLDVRETWEIETASISDSIHIAMSDVQQRHTALSPEVAVAVLCHSGVRSARVAHYLAAIGFQRIANITGGIDAWAQDLDETIPRY